MTPVFSLRLKSLLVLDDPPWLGRLRGRSPLVQPRPTPVHLVDPLWMRWLGVTPVCSLRLKTLLVLVDPLWLGRLGGRSVQARLWLLRRFCMLRLEGSLDGTRRML